MVVDSGIKIKGSIKRKKTYIYVYMYICIEREQEKESETSWSRYNNFVNGFLFQFDFEVFIHFEILMWMS